MSDQQYACATCRRTIDPLDDGTVFASEQAEVTAYGDAHRQFIDGLGVMFHPRCWPGDSMLLKRRPRPAEFALE